MTIKRPIVTDRMPQQANAGLNFYASVALVAGPTQFAILEAVFPDLEFAPSLVVATTVAGVLIAPLLTQFAFRSGTKGFLGGFLIRAALTAVLAGLVAFASALPGDRVGVFALYLFLFLLLGVVHKVYFNVGWLHVMGAVTPEDRANDFVARVRRVNGVTTAILSAGTFLALQFGGTLVFLSYIWLCALAYGFRSYWVVRRAIATDGTLQSTLQISFARESDRYPLVELLREFRHRRTWQWLWPAILPTFLVPPVLFLFAVQILGLNWQYVLLTLLAAHLFASFVLPRFVELFRVMPIDRTRIVLLVLATINVGLLVANKAMQAPEHIALALIGANAIIAASTGQALGIVVHNDVVRIGISSLESPRTFVVYNFALDVVPGVWMVLATLLIAASDRQQLLTPYEGLCVLGLTIFAASLIKRVLSDGQRLKDA